MRILSAHPIAQTAHVARYDYKMRMTLLEAPMRRLASFATRTIVIELLRNNVQVIRPSWHVYYSIGTLTLAVIRKD